MNNTISITSSDGRSLCETCLELIEENSVVCPHCGHTIEARASRRPAALPLGTILLGKYLVGKVLGMGGFGITYLAYDMIMNRKVAIKEYYPTALASRTHNTEEVVPMSGEKDSEFQRGAQKFYEEAARIACFNGNPNIISVYEFFYQNNTAYYAMEYLEGDDLVHYLNKAGKGLSSENLMYLLGKVTDALMIVHSANLLHRDIAPDNIFICKNGDVKLIDFGAARQYMSQESQSMSVIVKMGFAPIEQYQKKGRQGPWTDIYALGATAYYTLTGKKPDDPFSRMSNPAIDFSGIDPRIAKILNKMLAVQPNQRYQSIFELKDALAHLNIMAIPFVSGPAKPPFASASTTGSDNANSNPVTMKLSSDFEPSSHKAPTNMTNRGNRGNTVPQPFVQSAKSGLKTTATAKRNDVISLCIVIAATILNVILYLVTSVVIWYGVLSGIYSVEGSHFSLLGWLIIYLALSAGGAFAAGYFLLSNEKTADQNSWVKKEEDGISILGKYKLSQRGIMILGGIVGGILLIALVLIGAFWGFIAIENALGFLIFGVPLMGLASAATTLYAVFAGRLLPFGEKQIQNTTAKNNFLNQFGESKKTVLIVFAVLAVLIVFSFLCTFYDNIF